MFFSPNRWTIEFNLTLKIVLIAWIFKSSFLEGLLKLAYNYYLYIILQKQEQQYQKQSLNQRILIGRQLQMEEVQRTEGRLLSALSDLRLQSKKLKTREDDYQQRRKLKKIGLVKDDGEEIIYQRFINIFRHKKIQDKKIISDSLTSHFTFSYLQPKIREKLIQKFNFCKVEEGCYLMKQGDNASCFFILHEGTMSIQIDGEIRKRISPTDSGFGELGLLFSAPRSASIKAQTTCFLWYIDRTTFKTAVQDIIQASYKENKQFIDKSQYLSELSNGQRQALADIAMNQYYQKFTRICKEGELASSFYILKTGRIRRLREGTTIGFIQKGQIFESDVAIEDNYVRKQTLITEESSHILAISVNDIRSTLGKSLPIMLIRNQLKQKLKKEAFFQKLSKKYQAKLLDSFIIVNVQPGKTIIDTYKKLKNSVIFILQGDIDIFFPKFISSKSTIKILTSLKEIKNSTKQTFDKKQIFGVDSLRKAAFNEKADDYFELNIQLLQKGKIAKTSLSDIEKSFGCSLIEAIKKSAQQKEEKRVTTSKVFELRDLTRNYQLNHFSARKVLGSGAYGKVLLVTHEKENAHFALKCISKKPLVKQKHIGFVKEEKETLSLISLKDYPFFVKYYRSFRDNYYIYFLTEYIEGKDLFDVIRAIGILSIQQARFYIALLIHILEIMHQENIIYRDLKPENIMVGRDGYLKLVDMGTCKRMLEHQNRTFSFIGTPEYMAPEIFTHKGYSYTADLWSLGAIFYELLAGKNPFIDIDTEDMKEIYDQIMNNPLEFPQFMKDSTHPQMKSAKNLISLLLDKSNPSNRLGGSFDNLKKHQFFKGFDWELLLSKKMSPAHYIGASHLLNEQKIKLLPSRSILTYLKDWNCDVPKVKGLAENWDDVFTF